MRQEFDTDPGTSLLYRREDIANSTQRFLDQKEQRGHHAGSSVPLSAVDKDTRILSRELAG